MFCHSDPLLVDPAIGNPQRHRDAIGRDGMGRVKRKRPRVVSTAMGGRDELDNHLAGFVSAHSVGHDEEPEIGVDEMRVLIGRTRPGFRPRGDGELHQTRF